MDCNVNPDDIETAFFFPGPRHPDYSISYVMKAGYGCQSKLWLTNMSGKNLNIDCGIIRLSFKRGSAIALSMMLRNGYEDKMRMDGVSMPWLREESSINAKKNNINMKIKTKDKCCDECSIKSTQLQKCSRCKRARYCSRRCQKIAWNPKHR